MTSVGFGSEVERIKKFYTLAEAAVVKGERALQTTLIIPGAPHVKYHDSIHWYKVAFRSYGVAGEWEDAADACAKASKMCAHIGMTHEAALLAVEAADAVEKVNPTEAVNYLLRATALFSEISHFGAAAKLSITVAEMLSQDGDLEGSCERFLQASEYFLGDDQPDSSIEMLHIAAHQQADLGHYETATDLFEEVARSFVDHNLLRLELPDIFFKASLCQLANQGPIREGLAKHAVIRKKLRAYTRDIDYTFIHSREYRFLVNLLAIIPEADIGKFAEHTYQFDMVKGFDLWTLKRLDRIRKDIQDELDLRVEIESSEQEKNAKEQRILDGVERPT